MESIEAKLKGILSSTDHPEVRIRLNRNGKYSVRIYAHNREKTAHGVADEIGEAVDEAIDDRGGRKRKG